MLNTIKIIITHGTDTMVETAKLLGSKIQDKVIVLIGKRDTGKSFLCKDLLFHHQNIPVGQVISGTESDAAYNILRQKCSLRLIDSHVIKRTYILLCYMSFNKEFSGRLCYYTHISF